MESNTDAPAVDNARLCTIPPRTQDGSVGFVRFVAPLAISVHVTRSRRRFPVALASVVVCIHQNDVPRRKLDPVDAPDRMW